jgi:hypothetical protein
MTERSKAGLRVALAAAMLVQAGAVLPAAAQAPANDYPTQARAEYVFACMETSGQTHESLSQCSCSIDVIASILPYEKYVEAETALSIGLAQSGRLPAMMKATALTKNMVASLRRAQAEAEVRCF